MLRLTLNSKNSRSHWLSNSVTNILVGTAVAIGSSAAFANPELMTKLRELKQNGKQADAIELVQKEMQKNPTGEERKLLPFTLAMLYYTNGDYEKAATAFDGALKEKSNLEEYGYFYKGMSFFNLKKYAEAQTEFKKVDTMSPNAKLKIDSVSMLGQIALQQG